MSSRTRSKYDQYSTVRFRKRVVLQRDRHGGASLHNDNIDKISVFYPHRNSKLERQDLAQDRQDSAMFDSQSRDDIPPDNFGNLNKAIIWELSPSHEKVSLKRAEAA